MQITRRGLAAGAALAATLPSAGRRARAQDRTIRLGVLNDQSGTYRDITGQSSVASVRQAVQDFGDKGFPVEVVFADHQSKPDVGVSVARRWFDQAGVDVILDVPTSSVALAVNSVVKEKNKVYVNSGAATADLTGPACTPNTIHWAYDTWMLARSTGGAMTRAGGDSWYFVTADYVFGHQLQRDTAGFVTAAGGKVLGDSRFPFPGTTDFSSFLLSARSSRAKVLGLATAGNDTVNLIKQAAEFGLTRNMKLAAMLMFLSDVHSLGLETAQGLSLTESFYWDLNDRTRAFTQRVLPKMPNGIRPNMVNAGCYAGALHYLKAVADVGVETAKRDGAAVVARMKAMPTDDDCFGQARIREDGLVPVPSYLFEVKKPSESKGPWDYYKTAVTTPAAEAWKPLAEAGCPLVKA